MYVCFDLDMDVAKANINKKSVYDDSFMISIRTNVIGQQTSWFFMFF